MVGFKVLFAAAHILRMKWQFSNNPKLKVRKVNLKKEVAKMRGLQAKEDALLYEVEEDFAD